MLSSCSCSAFRVLASTFAPTFLPSFLPFLSLSLSSSSLHPLTGEMVERAAASLSPEGRQDSVPRPEVSMSRPALASRMCLRLCACVPVHARCVSRSREPMQSAIRGQGVVQEQSAGCLCAHVSPAQEDASGSSQADTRRCLTGVGERYDCRSLCGSAKPRAKLHAAS